MGSGGIFINYRRSTTAAAAGRLHDRLEQHFARRDLFMDVDAIEPGLDFVKILNDRVNSCRAFIAVIGTGWAEALDPAGGRRLDNPDDYVRVEIEAALKRDIRVIPVLVDGAQMPTAMELPPSLRPLVHRQAIELSHARFALDVDLLANAIKRADQENSAKTITFRESGQNAPSSLNQILFSLRGRISRATYWNGLAIYIAAVFLMSSLLGVYFFIDVLDTGASLEWSIYGNWRYRFLTLIICLPFYWPYFALLLKRLHDLGQGWQLLSILVLISFSTMIVVALGYKEYHIWLAIMMGTVAVFLGTIAGQVGPNRYGPAPLSRMSVRNGRPIFGSWTWRRFGAMAAGLLILISVPLLVRHFELIGVIERIRLTMSAADRKFDDIWIDKPGEWVMFEYSTPVKGGAGVAHFFKPTSVRIIGDRVAYETRYPLIQGGYEIITYVIDCKESVAAMAEKAVYNKDRQAMSRFKWGDPESLNLSIGGPIGQGSVLAVAQRILCNEQMRSALLSKERIYTLTYLTRALTGDADILYGATGSTHELVGVARNDVDYPFTKVFSSESIVGLPARSLRYRANLLRFDCTNRKVEDVKSEFYDSEGNLINIIALLVVNPLDVPQGSPFEKLLSIACKFAVVPKVQGACKGTNNVTYVNQSRGPTARKLRYHSV